MLQIRKLLVLFIVLFSSKNVNGQFYYQDDPQPQRSALIQKIMDATQPIKDSYSNLPPKGKFATGAVVGFSTVRFTLSTATRALKIGGAAFLISEALHASGVMNNIDFIPEEHTAKLQQVKMGVLREADKLRLQVRENYLNLDAIRSYVNKALEKDALITSGFATGAAIDVPKATLKVYPDKTRELDAEKRFIAKRVFDALSQAMTEFENNSS